MCIEQSLPPQIIIHTFPRYISSNTYVAWLFAIALVASQHHTLALLQLVLSTFCFLRRHSVHAVTGRFRLTED